MIKNIQDITTNDLEAELERRKSKRAEVAAQAVARAPIATLVHPDDDGFKEKVTPKKPDQNMFFFKCGCGGVHYRHAGYTKTFIPYIKPGGVKEVVADSRQVMVCVACRRSYVWAGEQMYEVTEMIDLKAWEKSEVELNKATGPGGEC